MGLSKEEKKARNEAKKLEKKQAAEAMRRKIKYDELEREVTAHELWRDQLEQYWRDVMIKVKDAVYRQQIEVLWHTLDRAYDKRDGLRDHIMYLKDIANNQYQRTIMRFCEVTANIINNFLSDLEDLCKQNEKKTKDIVKQGQVEVAYLLEYKRQSETHMHMLLYTSHEAADSKAWTTKGENMVRKDEDASTCLEILENLKYILEGNYIMTWDDYKSTLRGYIQSTSDNQKQLRALRKKEQIMVDLIAAQAKKIIISERVIRRLRIEVLAYETGEKQAGFRDRRNRHRTACARLKNSLKNGVEIDVKQLNKLVKASDVTIEWLDAAKKKCEKILRMAALCRKFETQREKVIPYEMNIPHELIKKNVRPHPSEDPLVLHALSSTCGLTRLWKRISKAELSKRALIREKTRLERENAIMEHEIKKKNVENLFPNTVKCSCKQKTLKKKIPQPHAVEGNMEIRKFIR